MGVFKRKRKKDGLIVYGADFYAADGRRVRELPEGRKAFDRKEAVALWHQRRAEVAAGTYRHPDDPAPESPEGPSFRKVAEEVIAERREVCRSNHYDDTLKYAIEYFGDKPIRSITRVDVDDYRRWRRAKNGRSPKYKLGDDTLRQNLQALRRVFTYAQDRGWIESSPAAKVELPPTQRPRPRSLTADELARLLAEAPPWLRPLLQFAVLTGLRLKEVAEIRWSCVDLKASRAYLDGENKTRSDRSVALSADAVALLEGIAAGQEAAWREACRASQSVAERPEFVFAGPEGKPIVGERERLRVTMTTVRAAKRAGLEGVSFHKTRHTAATMMIARGVDVTVVQKVLGHKNIKTTLVYREVLAEEEAKGVAALNGLFDVAGSHRMDTAPAASEGQSDNRNMKSSGISDLKDASTTAKGA